MPSYKAITQLEVVSAPSLAKAIAACQLDRNERGTNYIVGNDWAMGQDSTEVTYACVGRSPVASLTDPATNVLVRVRVFDDTNDCPVAWERLLAPRNGIIVCTKWAPATPQRLASFDYVADLDVAHERFYSDAASGWTTLPISAHIKTTNNAFAGVFLSVRYPSEPITDLRVLRPVSSFDVCEDHFGVSWLSVENIDPDARVAFCISRLPDPATARVLTGLTVQHDASSPCNGSTIEVTSTVTLCAEWSSATSAGPRNTDLVLVSSMDLNTTAAVAGATTSGFAQVTSSPLALSSNASVLTDLFVRSTQAPIYVPAPQDAANIAKPPLTAKSVVGNSTTLLSFKILQLADLHFTGESNFACRDSPSALASTCTEHIMSQFIDDLLDTEKPNFVVFTGDNVDTRSAPFRAAAVDAFTRSVEARKIPFAFVLGNHDDDGGFPREEVFAAVMNKSSCYAQHGPLNVDGLGNYALNVHAPTSGPWGKDGAPVFRLYFLDSHAFTNTTAFPSTNSKYGWIQPSQLEYFRAMAAENTAQTPALLFYHIPIPEYATTYFAKGEGNETPCSASVNSHLHSTLADVGDVKATFVGHDHLNQYCAERDGVQLCYGGGAGFGLAYGASAFPRRARVIEWIVNGSNYHEIHTWSRFYGNLSEKQHAQVLFQGNQTYNAPPGDAIRPTPSSKSVGVIAGSTVAAGVIVLAAVAVYWWKAKRHAEKKNKSAKHEANAVRPSQVVDPISVSLAAPHH